MNVTTSDYRCFSYESLIIRVLEYLECVTILSEIHCRSNLTHPWKGMNMVVMPL